MHELFIDEGADYSEFDTYLRKVSSAELEEDATQWPRQVLTELFRVLPEIAEYVPEVKFIKVNEEQGYAVGVVVVTNTTNSALSASPSKSTSPTPRALIPVVVKNGRLAPLDMLMSSSGKMWPLTVERLRETLYRPESFELVTEDWGDSALASIFSPPGSQGFGTGGTGLGGGTGMGAGGAGGVQYMMGPGMGGMKMSMLEAIDGTVLAPDVLRFEQMLCEHADMKVAAVENPAMLAYLDALSKVATVTEGTAAAYEQLLDDMRAVDVALMQYDDRSGMYAVKTANRDVGLQRVRMLDRGDFIRFAGTKIAERVDTEGSVVASAPGTAVIVSGPHAESPKLIERSGFWTVFNAITGAPLRGHVVVGLIDATGARIPLSLFIHSHGASVQDQLSGTYGGGDRTDIPNDQPKGTGCFVVGDDDHKLEATVEMNVQGSIGDAGAIKYHCVDTTGAEVTVVLQAGMEGIAAFPDRKEIILPRSARFVSTANPVAPLVEKAPGALDKTSSALLDGRVTVTATPGAVDAYQLAFRNLPKLAGALPEHSGLDFNEALYALCLAGLGPNHAFTALNKVASDGRCVISTEDFGERPMPPVKKIAHDVVEVRMLHPHLIKEALAMPDAMTVDAVLSLDFITSENVRTFISMIPYLEKALNKICELTFAARLGLTEIPEAATARAARGMNDAIRGLKALALRQIEELP